MCPVGTRLQADFADATLLSTAASANMNDTAIPFAKRDEHLKAANIRLGTARTAFLEHRAGCAVCGEASA